MSDTDLEATGGEAPASPASTPARQRSEQDYIDLAEEIGFARPNMRQTTDPEAFRQWADRVEQGLSYLNRGEYEKFREIKQEADVYAGARERAPAPDSRNDPLEKVVTRLDELRPFVKEENPALESTIERLAAERVPPGSPSRDDYETEVSRALQDTERLVGPVDADPASKAALARRATSVPGLENERLKRLLEITPELADQKLIDRIRASADEIAASPEQNNDRIREVVAVGSHLAARIRNEQFQSISDKQVI
jgi:hypothetical protein